MLANHVERSLRLGRPRFGTRLNSGDPIAGAGDFCTFPTPSWEPPHRPSGEAVRAALAAARRHGVAAGIHSVTTETLGGRIAGAGSASAWLSDQRYLAGAARAVGGGAAETERM